MYRDFRKRLNNNVLLGDSIPSHVTLSQLPSSGK